MTYPWLEKWGPPVVLPLNGRQHVATIAIDGSTDALAVVAHETHLTARAIDVANDGIPERARLAAAAPALARDVIRHEWSAQDIAGCRACPACGGLAPTHDPGCPRDATLTSIGLPDQASRDAARVLLTECRCPAGILPPWTCIHTKAREELVKR